MRIKTGLILSLFLSFCSLVIAGEETIISFDKVPEEILNQAQQLLPEAHFKTANIETEEDGTRVYEIQGILADGRKVEVDVLENGEIEEFEVEYTRDLVPGAVLKAIEKRMPGFIITYIEASYSASKKVIKYEFVGTLAGKQLDLEVSASGRIIELADK